MDEGRPRGALGCGQRWRSITLLDTGTLICVHLFRLLSAYIGDKDLGFSSQIKTDKGYDER
jgi:hypothetical protein